MSGGYIGRDYDEAEVAKVLTQVAPLLDPGEPVVGLLRCLSLSPSADTLVVMPERILQVETKLSGQVARSVRREDVTDIGVLWGMRINVFVRTEKGREKWGTPDHRQREETHKELRTWLVGPDELLEGAGTPEKREADEALLVRLLGEAREHMAATGGLSLQPDVREQVQAASPPGEEPSVVIAEKGGRFGALVGFSDRLVVIGLGLNTKPTLTGTVLFKDVKDIRYNPGKDMVLVEPRDGAPMRVPLSAGSYVTFREPLDRLRAAVAAPSGSAVDLGDLADDLTKLADLYTAGALTEAEFAAAKRSLLGT